MKCPFCGAVDSKVIDSRSTEEGVSIRRWRECFKCAKRFTTYEKVESIPIMVIKKDKRREPFDSSKIMRGLTRACEKRPISVDMIEDMVFKIETKIYNTLEREITSDQIGEMLLEQLKDVDEVAFIRFASVYRDFKDIETFRNEINKIMRH